MYLLLASFINRLKAMKNFTYLNLLMLLLLSSFTLPAAAAEIKGKVVGSGGVPLDYVSVILARASDSARVMMTMTDASGVFIFKGVKAGKYNVVLSLIGRKMFRTDIMQITDDANLIDLGTLTMETESRQLSSVSVVAKKSLIERVGDKLILNVSASSVSAGASALEVLQRAPGVSVDKDDNISLRGKQGVLVMIDGKQTYLSAADLATMLRNMQSNEIESIEVIANPSARYEAEGKSGIINIRLKKNKSYGTNGTITAGGGYSGYRKTNTGVTLNSKSARLNVFANYNYNNNEGRRKMDIDRINEYEGISNFFSQKSDGKRRWDNHSVKLGADWQLHKDHVLGAQINAYSGNWRERSTNRTGISTLGGPVDSTVLSSNTFHSKNRNISYNINYRGKLDTLGREISVDLDYSTNKSEEDIYYDNLYQYVSAKPEMRERINTLIPVNIAIYAIKADYVHPLSKALKFEAGYKSSWVETDNDFGFNVMVDGQWDRDLLRSNHFIYDENINAGYLIIKGDLNKWNVQAGLRAEQTNSRGNLVTTGQVVKRHYLDFFPSAAINYTMNPDHALGFTYSRRITRPQYDALNPFEFFIDRYTFNRGNPFLKPEYTNAVEMSYTFKKKYILSASFARTTDGITEVILPEAAKSALYQTRTNMAEQNSWTLNLTAPISFTSWWTSNTNALLFRNQFKSPDLNGQKLDNDQTTLMINHVQTFTVDKTMSVELSGNFHTKEVYATLAIKPRYTVDLGISKSFADKRFDVRLAMVDIFRTSYTRISSAYPGLDYKLFQRGDTRMLRLSMSYRFGNKDMKLNRGRATGLEEEAGRVKK